MRGSRRRLRPERRDFRLSPTIPVCASMRSTASPESIRRAGRAHRRISRQRCRRSKGCCRSGARPSPRNAWRISSPRWAWRGPRGTLRKSRSAPTARWSGRRAAAQGSAMIRPSSRTAMSEHSVKRRASRSMACRPSAWACRTARRPSRNSRRSAMHADAQNAFGVFVHWPFCMSKCPYCDFNSHVRHTEIDEERFARAFAREIATTAARTGKRDVTSIFLGGGTPSLMKPQTVGAVLDAIAQHWSVDSGVEVTLEANPTSVEATRFAGYRAAGVNRVSLGVQALDDASLKALGRLHSAQEALDAVAIARRAFDRYSFDLIYARPDQTAEAWTRELKLAISEAAEHLSLYQLTIEEGTPFFGLHRAGT